VRTGDDPERELVFGIVVIAPGGMKRPTTSEQFKEIVAPGIAKAVMNFRRGGRRRRLPDLDGDARARDLTHDRPQVRTNLRHCSSAVAALFYPWALMALFRSAQMLVEANGTHSRSKMAACSIVPYGHYFLRSTRKRHTASVSNP